MKDNRELKNVYLFLVGKITSLLGSQIYTFAISLYVLKYTESAALFAITMITSMIPRIVLSPFAGVIADKFSKKKLVVSMDFLSGFVMFGVFLYSSYFEFSLWAIYITTFLLSICSTLFDVSFSASIPELVTEKNLVKINSFSSSASSFSMIVGPVFGGLVYALVDIKVFLLINGVSFVLSGITEMFIDFNLNKKEDHTDILIEKTSMIEDMKSAIVYLKSNKLIMSLIFYIMLVNFFANSMNVLQPYSAVNVIGINDTSFGITQGAFAVGMLITSIIMSSKKEFKNAIRTLYIGVMGIGLMFVILSQIVSYGSLNISIAIISLIVFNFTMGAMIIVINIPFSVTMQKQIDMKYMGRVNGLMGSLSMGLSPLSIVITGILIDIMNPVIILIVAGIMLVIAGAKMSMDKKIKLAMETN